LLSAVSKSISKDAREVMQEKITQLEKRLEYYESIIEELQERIEELESVVNINSEDLDYLVEHMEDEDE
jgi:uncharacterized coiled-coil protein SlyX